MHTEVAAAMGGGDAASDEEDDIMKEMMEEIRCVRVEKKKRIDGGDQMRQSARGRGVRKGRGARMEGRTESVMERWSGGESARDRHTDRQGGERERK